MSEAKTALSEEFDRQKRMYFYGLGLQVRDALRLHEAAGLWERNEEKERSFRRVSQHCLAEVARVSVLADHLGFSEDTKKIL